MTDDLRTKIESEIDETAWDALAAHAKRQALFVVDPSVGLVTAALAIAQNRAAVVQHWIESGVLARPSPDECAVYDLEPLAYRFRIAIVQPHVLVERVAPSVEA